MIRFGSSLAHFKARRARPLEGSALFALVGGHSMVHWGFSCMAPDGAVLVLCGVVHDNAIGLFSTPLDGAVLILYSIVHDGAFELLCMALLCGIHTRHGTR